MVEVIKIVVTPTVINLEHVTQLTDYSPHVYLYLTDVCENCFFSLANFK